MATTYVVTATRLDRIDKDGKRKKYYRGDPITGLSAEDVERYKRGGAIASASNEDAKAAKADETAGPNPSETSTGDPSTPEPTGITVPQASDIVAAVQSTPAAVKPPRAGSTDAWRTYAVASGQLTEDEASKKSRDDLRDALN